MSMMFDEPSRVRRNEPAASEGIEMTDMSAKRPAARPTFEPMEIEAAPVAPEKKPSFMERFWGGAKALWGKATGAIKGALLGKLGMKNTRDQSEKMRQINRLRDTMELDSDAGKAAQQVRRGAVDVQAKTRTLAAGLAGQATEHLAGVNAQRVVRDGAEFAEAASNNVIAKDAAVQRAYGAAQQRQKEAAAGVGAVSTAQTLAAQKEGGISKGLQERFKRAKVQQLLRKMATNNTLTNVAAVAEKETLAGMSAKQSAKIQRDGADERLAKPEESSLGTRILESVRSGAQGTKLAANIVQGEGAGELIDQGRSGLAMGASGMSLANQAVKASQVARPVATAVGYGATAVGSLASAIETGTNKLLEGSDQAKLQRQVDSGAWKQQVDEKGVRIKPTWQE